MSKKPTAVRQINKLAADDDITFQDQGDETCSNTETYNNVFSNRTTDASKPETLYDRLIVAT